jgi:DNA-binding HxlR family transcriptional regulator
MTTKKMSDEEILKEIRKIRELAQSIEEREVEMNILNYKLRTLEQDVNITRHKLRDITVKLHIPLTAVLPIKKRAI